MMDFVSNFKIKVNDVFAKEKIFTTICSSADDAKLCSVEVNNILLFSSSGNDTDPITGTQGQKIHNCEKG